MRFENLRIEETRRLISLWIGKAFWTRDAERGHIRDVVFKTIAVAGDAPAIELTGSDAGHAIENVKFEGVTVNGRPLTSAAVKSNAFVRGVDVKP